MIKETSPAALEASEAISMHRSSLPLSPSRGSTSLAVSPLSSRRRTDRKSTHRTRKAAQTASRFYYEANCWPAFDLRGRLRGAVYGRHSWIGPRSEFSRKPRQHHVSKSDIDPRCCGRRRLRHLVNPEALSIARARGRRGQRQHLRPAAFVAVSQSSRSTISAMNLSRV